MVKYNNVDAKSSDSQLNSFKTVVKNERGVTLWRAKMKIFNGNSLLNELLLTTRQKSKLKNAFKNNISIYNLRLS